MTTFRIAHLADPHCDERRDLNDWSRVMKAFIEQAHERASDLILIAGDFFERKSTPAERNAMADFLLEAGETVAPVYGVEGNHDAEGDLEIFSRLEAEESFIEILDRPTAEPKSARTYTHYDDDGEARLAILALPWFSKQHIAASLPADTPAAETTERTIAAARELLSLLRAEADRSRGEGCIPLLVAHCQVAGSEVSTGQTLIGTTVELSPGDLRDVGCEYAALGHIHKAQSWYDGQVAYAGSPLRCNFGEPEAKGWNLVTLEDGRWKSTEFVELPARRIVLLEPDWTDIVDRKPFGVPVAELKDTLVRVRYRVPVTQLHRIDDEMHIAGPLRSAGALDVKIEPVIIHESQARCEAIVDADTVWEKLTTYWEARGIEIFDEQRERLRMKVSDLEQREGVRDAAA